MKTRHGLFKALSSEKADLDLKIERLVDFIAGKKYEELDGRHRQLLRSQLKAMKGYSLILAKRIALAIEWYE